MALLLRAPLGCASSSDLAAHCPGFCKGLSAATSFQAPDSRELLSGASAANPACGRRHAHRSRGAAVCRISSRDYDWRPGMPILPPRAPPEPEQEPPKRAARKKMRRAPVPPARTVPWGWDGGESGALQEWLARRGLPPQKLALRGVKEGGRGLVAMERVGRGETLLFVPESALITPEFVYASPEVGAHLARCRVPEWPALAIYLIREAAKGSASEWAPYIAELPQRPCSILQWDLADVDELLEGSPTRGRALEAVADVDDTFRDLDAQLFSKHPDVFSPDVFDLTAFRWAFGILFSRLVRLPSAGGRLALVPWGDMLNHKCEQGSYLDFDAGKNAVVLKTDRSYEAGQQVYASYGPRSNGELMLAYGIVPAGRNPSDAVELTLGLNPDDESRDAKLAALRSHRLTSPQSYPAKMEGLPAQMVAYAKLVAAGPETPRGAFEELAAAAAGAPPVGAATVGGWRLPLMPGGGGDAANAPALEIAAREVILAVCEATIAGYSSSSKDDEALSDSIEEDQEVEEDSRALAAAALRTSERRILNRADFVLRSELKRLRGCGGGDGRRAHIDLGNNLGGERGTLVEKIISKITRPS